MAAYQVLAGKSANFDVTLIPKMAATLTAIENGRSSTIVSREYSLGDRNNNGERFVTSATFFAWSMMAHCSSTWLPTRSVV